MMQRLTLTLRSLTLCLLLAVTFAACTPAEPDAPGPVSPGDPGSYPAGRPSEANRVPTAAYPAGQPPTLTPLPATPVPDAYTAGEQFAEPRFAIDRPLRPGDTTISGQALPNLLVEIRHITYGGFLLGSVRTGGDGRFSITVDPLQENHSVGVALGELPAGQTIEDLMPHRSDAARLVPNVGFFFDIARVVP